MKLAFVMDPISQISYKKDSTLARMVEAQEKALTNLVQNFLLFQLNMKNLAGMKRGKITSRH